MGSSLPYLCIVNILLGKLHLISALLCGITSPPQITLLMVYANLVLMCRGVLQGAVPTCVSKAALDDCNSNNVF
jgi:hypothetical protein